MIRQILDTLNEPTEMVNDNVNNGPPSILQEYDDQDDKNGFKENGSYEKSRKNHTFNFKVRKFEKIQELLDEFISVNSQETFTFPELRHMSLSDKERFLTFLFEVLREERIAETEILQEENAEAMESLRGQKPRGFWSFFERKSFSASSSSGCGGRRRQSFGSNSSVKHHHHDEEDEDEAYDDPELFANLTVLKLSCLKTLRLLSRDKVVFQDEVGPKILSEDNLMILVSLLKMNPFALDAVITAENPPPPPPPPPQNDEVSNCHRLSWKRKGSKLNDKPATLDKVIYSLPEEERIQILETQKCLCNFTFNGPERIRNILSSSLAPQIILNRNADRFWKVDSNRDLVFFDQRFLFLLTAFNAPLRSRLMGFGDDSFKDVTLPRLNQMIIFYARLSPLIGTATDSSRRASLVSCNSTDLEIVNEILKVLFNLTMVLKPKHNTVGTDTAAASLATPDQPAQLSALVHTCRALLSVAAGATGEEFSEKKRFELDGNVVNLLTNFPPEFYQDLIPSPKTTTGPHTNNSSNSEAALATKNIFEVVTSPPSKTTENYDMTAIREILTFFTSVLNNLLGGCDDAVTDSPDVKQLTTARSSVTTTTRRIEGDDKALVLPTLLFLSEACKRVRPIRKYLKAQILPAVSMSTREELKQLPERGTSLRNRLCKLMTSPTLELKELSAELLFALCKENVNKLVRYTGYGNAAGLLARLGLMTGGSGPNRGQYSSDSDDDIDEETAKNINPVTGQWESDETIEERGKALSNLTDEEKIERAEEISRLLKSLKATGIISPIAIGKDGRPIPFEFDETSGPKN